MDKRQLYKTESGKNVMDFVQAFSTICKVNDFTINNTDNMNMASSFAAHGVSVPDHFDLHMMQVCKPLKASKSLFTNPERSVLMPKFVMVFSINGKTQIRYLSHDREEVGSLIDDQEFPESLAQTAEKIRSMIDEAC